MSKRYKKDGLVSKVIPFHLLRDESGEYIPFCEANFHKGIVLRKYVCEQRNCKWYRKLYIDGIGRVDEPRNDDSDCRRKYGN